MADFTTSDTTEPNTCTIQDQRYNAVPPSLYRLCQETGQVSMQEAFNKTPYDWQQFLISHLLLMTCPASTFPPAPVFLCAPTGGGKSLARDSFAATQGRVSWCICPLLSLGVDQEKNINYHSQQGDGSVVAFHIDSYRSASAQRSLCNRVKALRPDSKSSVVIISSPQALTKNQEYLGLFCYLVENSMLSLFSVDEVQLFVQFGARFRSEFYGLCNNVFPRLIADDQGAITKCPILFMTATSNKTHLEQVEAMTGLVFDKTRNLLWPTADELVQRNVYIHVDMTVRPMVKLSSFLLGLAAKSKEDSVQRKWLVFANSRVKVEELAENTKAFLDDNSLPGDIITIIGTQTKEEKLFYTQLLLSPSDPSAAFSPVGGYITRSLGSAGLDDKEIHFVFSPDWPTSIASLWQERGRAGRRPEANCGTDMYYVCISLETFVNLIRRVWLPEDPEVSANDCFLSRKEYRALFVNELMALVRLIVLASECLPAAFARSLGNPYKPAAHLPSCPVDSPACSFCDGSLSKAFPKLIRRGVQSALLAVFLGEDAISDPVLDGSFIQAFRTKSYNKQIFGHTENSPPTPKKIKAMVLMLLAADIVGYRVKFHDEDKKCERPIIIARLLTAQDGGLALDSDLHWNRIPTKA